MNKKYKALYVAALAAPMLLTTGCIEETLPTNGIVQSQLQSSSKATEALVWAMPAHFNTVGTVATDLHYDWGEGSIMVVRDNMIEDVVRTQSGYNWYASWSTATGLDEGKATTQFVWNYYWAQIITANKVIEAIDPATTNPDQLAQLGAGLCFRAYSYLDMARWYEFLPNNYVSGINSNGKDVTGLTVPIMT
ncbi:MAG: RagB/SusD family nutrient uptake outer membrane protein, partial [Muribaculaceae bacterium]|nr:RagB/SusD family nutrient uptake outer membrane protein [Muribaculaceae bacterium]